MVLDSLKVTCAVNTTQNKPKQTTSRWLGSIVVRASNMRLNSLLASEGWEMSTGQIAVKLCGWEVKAGMAHTTCG